MSSAKWRAMQHRHRYTYTAVVFPPSFISSLSRLLSDPYLSAFHSSLLHFTSLFSTLSQLSHVKHLATTFLRLLQSQPEPQPQPSPSLNLASQLYLYLYLLFLENSHPLHKTLLFPLAKTTPFRSTVASSFHTLLHSRTFSRVTVSRSALSVLGMPKLANSPLWWRVAQSSSPPKPLTA